MSKVMNVNMYLNLDCWALAIGVIGGLFLMLYRKETLKDWRDYTWLCVWSFQVACVFLLMIKLIMLMADSMWVFR